MNLKSNLFLIALNQVSKHLNQLGFSYSYTESQKRYNKSNRTESANTGGMQTIVFSRGRHQVGLTLSDDRQLPLTIHAGFSLSNSVFIPVAEFVTDSGKDYPSQVKVLARIPFKLFSEILTDTLALFDSIVKELADTKEVSAQSLIDSAIAYRNTFSSTSPAKKVIYCGQVRQSAFNALRTAFDCLFNSVKVADQGLLFTLKGNGVKHVLLTQLRYKTKLVNHLLDSVY